MTGAGIDLIATAVEQRVADASWLAWSLGSTPSTSVSTAWPTRCGTASCTGLDRLEKVVDGLATTVSEIHVVAVPDAK